MGKIDKGKIIIVASMSVVVIGICIGLYMHYTRSDATELTTNGFEFSPPSALSERKEFKSKLDAYKKKEQAKNNPVMVTNPFQLDTKEDSIIVLKSEGESIQEEKSVKEESPINKKEKKQVGQEPVVEQKRRRVGFAQKKTQSAKIDKNYYAELKVRISQSDKVKTGTLIYMRTIDSYKSAMGVIPSNTLITGKASLEGSRLFISVEAVKVSTGVLAKNLLAFDLQGNLGLPINASIENEVTNDVINEGIDEASSALNIPIISSLGSNSLKKITNATSVEIHKGGKFILKTILE